MDVLPSMFVTCAVSHFEMSDLNARACQNAVGVYVNTVDVEPERKKKETQNCKRTKLKEEAIDQEDNKGGSWTLDVLYSKLVTRAVIHFEMSALNARA